MQRIIGDLRSQMLTNNKVQFHDLRKEEIHTQRLELAVADFLKVVGHRSRPEGGEETRARVVGV